MAVYLPMIFIIILCLAERSGKVYILWFYKLLRSWNAGDGFKSLTPFCSSDFKCFRVHLL